MRSSAAALAVASNDDLLSEILSWLPSKPVVLFKMVCKRWLSLLSHPLFLATHTRRDRRAVSCLLLNWDSYDVISTYISSCSLDGGLSKLLPDPSLSFIQRRLCPAPRGIDVPPKFRIWNCCNGLILCSRAVRPSSYRFPRRAEFIGCVCNPTTMEYKGLPSPTIPFVSGATLAFDPSRSPYYRVVCIGIVNYYALVEGDYEFELAMYSSEAGTWESCGQCSLPEGVFCGNSVYWDGLVNWVTKKGSLLSFDMDKRQLLFTTSSYPFPVRILYFGESGGHLHLINCDGSPGLRSQMDAVPPCFDVREMARDRSGWNLLYRVDLRAVEGGERRPLFVVRGEGEEGDEVVMGMPGTIESYSLRKGTFRRVCTVPLAEGGRVALRQSDVIPYAHTLVSL